jgi:phage gpG-like protein
MAAAGGASDTDRGLGEIRKNIAALAGLRVKVGIPEGAGSTDGVPIAGYAAANEFGVFRNGKWRIPPRPFIRGWIENKEGSIKSTIEKLFALVSTGKLDARTAARRLGQFAEDGVKTFIREGSFAPNSSATMKKKKSDKPLIDNGAMRRAITHNVIRSNGGSG